MKRLIKQLPVLGALDHAACQRMVEFRLPTEIDGGAGGDTVDHRGWSDFHTGAPQQPHKVRNIIGQPFAAIAGLVAIDVCC